MTAITYQTPPLSTSPSGPIVRSTGLATAGIADQGTAAIPDGAGQRRQVRDGLVGLEPAGGIEVEPLDDPRCAGPKLGRQGGHDLELRRGDDRAETQLRGGAGQAGEEQGLGLVGGHAGQPRAVAVDQADAAERTALGEDRHAGRAQLLDVAMHGPHRDLELAREFSRGQAASALEQQEQVDETAGAHRAMVAERT